MNAVLTTSYCLLNLLIEMAAGGAVRITKETQRLLAEPGLII